MRIQGHDWPVRFPRFRTDKTEEIKGLKDRKE